MRGDIARLGRCTSICTQGEDTIRRSKPFKYAYEKEIVMWALSRSVILRWLSDFAGTPTSKNWIISQQNVYIPPTLIEDMRGRFWRI